MLFHDDDDDDDDDGNSTHVLSMFTSRLLCKGFNHFNIHLLPQ